MRLHLSIATAIGPRTVVTQGLSPVDARAIKDAIETLGGRAFLAEDVPLVPMKKRMEKMKREARRQKTVAAQKDDFTVQSLPGASATILGITNVHQFRKATS